MLKNVGLKLFGSRNARLMKSLHAVVQDINRLEATMQGLSDEALANKTVEFKGRLTEGETLDQILPEAFAVVREVSQRTLGMRHYDVQLLGGMVLHHGKIAEMSTGEGKTLSATLPAYLNALIGQSVHVVTVNPYLAARDAEWMSPIYSFLGLTVGVIVPTLETNARQQAYACDIVYGTNNEFGFDYLRDHMVQRLEDRVQKSLAFCIIDEVDSVLIDEARTPLIISGECDDDSAQFHQIMHMVKDLEVGQAATETSPESGDFIIDAQDKQVFLTDAGHAKLEQSMMQANLLPDDQSLYSALNAKLLYWVNACLRAIYCYHKDVDYIVQDGMVVIVDEHTGRTMPGRRWSDGLHQAIETLENVAVLKENKTLASITFQNYFRLYQKLSGMTGTADTEAYEFQQIYQLEVAVLPTHRPMIRKDQNDLMYVSLEDKVAAIVADIAARHKTGQPVLVGTASIESSEHISGLLKQAGIKHQVLNAKFHEQESHIIAQAGCLGAVTIATNMAGRGTDIVLGGNVEERLKQQYDTPTQAQIDAAKVAWKKEHEAVLALGGLYVLGAERHESRRIDNQLRGRCGRQGDPGETRFYLSLDDALMRIFASEKVKSWISSLSTEPGQALEQRMLSRSIESAQRKVEGHYFDMRKQLIRFDHIASEQRELIYKQRHDLMATEDIRANIDSMIETVTTAIFDEHVAEEGDADTWRLEALEKRLYQEFHLSVDLRSDSTVSRGVLLTKVIDAARQMFQDREVQLEDQARFVEKVIVLQALDMFWQEHLSAMEQLRMGIHLRSYAQKDPFQEFKRESFDLFTGMLTEMKRFSIARLLTFDVQALLASAQAQQTAHTFVARNATCPCGSGKKYKHCCGKLR